MNNREADVFLEKMQSLDNEVFDYIDAVCHAMKLVPKIDENTWFGEISTSDERILGTFYLSAISGGQCRWFDLLDAESASRFIINQLQEDLT